MSLKTYMDLYDEINNSSLINQQNALKKTAQSNIDTINASAQNSIDAIKSEGKTAEQEANEDYNNIVNTENVRRLINERKVAEAMANQGLTDSGLNRTQQTAVQLSHGNAVSKAELARQKQVDAIAQYIQQQIGTIETKKNADIADVKNTLTTNLAQAEATYQQNRAQWATEQYEAEQDRQQEGWADKTTHENFVTDWNTDGATEENVNKLGTYLQLYSGDPAFQQPTQDYITTLATSGTTSAEDMLNWINTYVNSYGVDDGFISNIIESPEFKKRFNLIEGENDSDPIKIELNGGRLNTGKVDPTTNAFVYVDGNGKQQTVYGIGADATTEGKDILDALAYGDDKEAEEATETRGSLLQAFQEGGMEGFMKAREQAIQEGYSSYSIDHMMNQNFGDLWLLAAATDDNYKGLLNSGIVTETDNGGINWGWVFDAGIDQNAKISVNGTEKSVADWLAEYLNGDTDVKETVLTQILKNYGKGYK